MTKTADLDQDGLNLSRLARLLARASSDNDAEAIAAVRAARTILAKSGLDFVDLAEALEQHSAVVETVADLKDTVSALRADMRRLKASVTTSAEASDLSRRLAHLNERLSEMRRKLNETEEERDALYMHASELSQELEDLKASIAMATSALGRKSRLASNKRDRKTGRQQLLF